MITRHEAETQAERCLEYHAAIAAGIAGITAVVDRRVFPWVAAGLGAGLAIHTACLFAIPSARESLLRTTASMMEDLRNSSQQSQQQERQQSNRPVASMNRA